MEYEHQPVSEALSMGVHESQSLLWERVKQINFECIFRYHFIADRISNTKATYFFFQSFSFGGF